MSLLGCVLCSSCPEFVSLAAVLRCVAFSLHPESEIIKITRQKTKNIEFLTTIVSPVDNQDYINQEVEIAIRTYSLLFLLRIVECDSLNPRWRLSALPRPTN